jgi:citrate lyase beta subunit
VTPPDSAGDDAPEASRRAPTQGSTRLTDDDLAALDAIVAPADERMARLYPGDRVGRQPVHTVYVPADQMTPDLTSRWGKAARAAIDQHAAGSRAFATAVGLTEQQGHLVGAEGIWERVLAKLDSEPIEDLRIDLEDGYTGRGDDTEDADAVSAAQALTAAVADGLAPPFSGIRFKSFEAATRRRGLRTLDLVLSTLLNAGDLPDGWVVTLPKVTSVEQVEAMVEACSRLESAYGLPERRLRFEIQIETAQAVLGPDGTTTAARLVHAADGRVTGLHFGTYDYTAGLGIAAGQQAMDHPAADHAKNVMALAVAQTGVRLSDGSTNVVPTGESAQVHGAWALHARLVRRSLERGFYQGWDLHPAQLPTRYVATYLFFRDGLAGAADRLTAYAAPGSESAAILDEPATAQALATFVLRGLDCGAVDPSELGSVTLDELRMLASRRPG